MTELEGRTDSHGGANKMNYLFKFGEIFFCLVLGFIFLTSSVLVIVVCLVFWKYLLFGVLYGR
jgi:hypothetical protein